MVDTKNTTAAYKGPVSVPDAVRRNLEMLLMRIKSAAKPYTSWKDEFKAAVLAARQLCIELVQEVCNLFGVTGKVIGEWSQKASIVAQKDKLLHYV